MKLAVSVNEFSQLPLRAVVISRAGQPALCHCCSVLKRVNIFSLLQLKLVAYMIYKHRSFIGCCSVLSLCVCVFATLGRSRLACKRGSCIVPGQNPYIVHISQSISMSHFYIQGFMIYSRKEKNFFFFSSCFKFR